MPPQASHVTILEEILYPCDLLVNLWAWDLSQGWKTSFKSYALCFKTFSSVASLYPVDASVNLQICDNHVSSRLCPLSVMNAMELVTPQLNELISQMTNGLFVSSCDQTMEDHRSPPLYVIFTALFPFQSPLAHVQEGQ